MATVEWYGFPIQTARKTEKAKKKNNPVLDFVGKRAAPPFGTGSGALSLVAADYPGAWRRILHCPDFSVLAEGDPSVLYSTAGIHSFLPLY